MTMLQFNKNNLSSDIGEYEKIATYFGVSVSDDCVWQQARQCEYFPILENIYQSILLDNIARQLEVLNIKTSTYINAADTHLHIYQDGWICINTYDEFLETFNSSLSPFV